MNLSKLIRLCWISIEFIHVDLWMIALYCITSVCGGLILFLLFFIDSRCKFSRKLLLIRRLSKPKTNNKKIVVNEMESNINGNAGSNVNSSGVASGTCKNKTSGGRKVGMRGEIVGKTVIGLICGSLVYYHCAYRNSSFLSLLSDVFIVLLCSLAILGLLFRQINIS